jgi:hypothetical protein
MTFKHAGLPESCLVFCAECGKPIPASGWRWDHYKGLSGSVDTYHISCAVSAGLAPKPPLKEML